MYLVDAFADRPFAGNPAAVCLLDAPADEQWMQQLAIEMNQAETAFVYRLDDEARFALRWFSVAGEVDVCGHATIAAAHVLWQAGVVPRSTRILFTSRAGTLSATDDKGVVILDFPADPAQETKLGTQLADALGATPSYTGRGRYYAIARFADEAAVRDLKPDFAALAALLADGIVCTAPSSSPDADVFSRYFGPSLGNPEDTVTGSSACLLGPYWAPELKKSRFVARQESGRTGRGGVILVSLEGDRVGIGGRAVTVLEGKLRPETLA
jgi:PhzF family phenazine biosynthesis protein